MATVHDRDFPLDVLIYRDGGDWVAHCLQLDIVGTSKISKAEAISEVVDLCEEQIINAFQTNNVDYLFKAAPPEIWDMFWQAESQGESISRRFEVSNSSHAKQAGGLSVRLSQPGVAA